MRLTTMVGPGLILISSLFFMFTSACPLVCHAQEEDAYTGQEAMKYFKEDRPRKHLVTRLYRAGALYVGVVDVMDEAAGLRVYLPFDLEPRQAIFGIANEALLQAGFRSEDDTGQDTVTIWFKG